MTHRKKPDPSEKYERKLAALDPDVQAVIKSAAADIKDEPNLSRLRRRTTRGTLLDFAAADVGYAIEYRNDGLPVDLHDLRFPVPR
jgi:hypothetical protein